GTGGPGRAVGGDMSSFNIWYTLITIAVVIAVLLGGGLYLVLLERKVSAWVQDRLGPNRVGMYGLIQPIADAFKLLFKEDVMTGSLNLERIIENQTESGWNIFFQPLAFLIFMVSAFAECNRLPFDLPEAEQELVGGYHTEYSGLKFVFFYLGEYTHLVTTSFLFVILFFGGWHFPLIAPAGPGGAIVKLIVMLL